MSEKESEKHGIKIENEEMENAIVPMNKRGQYPYWYCSQCNHRYKIR